MYDRGLGRVEGEAGFATNCSCRLLAHRVPDSGVQGPQCIFDSHKRSGGRSLKNVAQVGRTL